jgi:ribonuclease P protein component
MVSKTSRLPYKEFRERGYREITMPGLSVKVKKNSLGKNRLGVIVGVSSVKNATRRNLLRREAKSILLTVPQKEFDLLVILRSGAALLPKRTFQKKLSDAIVSLTSNL